MTAETIPSDQVLRCTCTGELAILRINGRLVLAHRVNPTFRRHYPRLARQAAENSRGTRRLDEGPATPRESAASAGSHPRTTRGTRAESNGSTRTASPSGSSAQPSGERASTSGEHPSHRTPRAPVAAGRSSIAGEA